MYEIYEELLNERNIKTSQVCKATGIPQSTFSDWKKGKSKPKIDKLQKIADFFEVSVDYLTGKSKYKNFDEIALQAEVAIFDKINFDKSNIKNIPIVGTVRAGAPILAQDNIEDYYPTLRKYLDNDKNYFYLKVKGDSMDLEFKEGSLLLIEQTNCIENGEIAVVLIDGQDATVKKITQTDNMITLIPCSTNPIHIPHMYDLQKDNVKIIGKVIQATKIY